MGTKMEFRFHHQVNPNPFLDTLRHTVTVAVLAFGEARPRNGGNLEMPVFVHVDRKSAMLSSLLQRSGPFRMRQYLES